MQWDLIVRNAKVFDGTGAPGRVGDIAISEGKIAARGGRLPSQPQAREFEAKDHWLTPGLLDIHTHEDLEAELEPGLPEVTRHGTPVSWWVIAASVWLLGTNATQTKTP